MKEKILILLLFCTLASSKCQLQSQSDGQCSSCISGYVLTNGYCVQRIRGCLRHLPDSRCNECQFGYVLSVGKCIRQAIFYGNTDLSPAPIAPSSQKFLTFEQIEDKLGKVYGPYFSNIHQFFLAKYEQLGKGNIKNVGRVQTKKGVIMKIQYSQNGKIFTAEASIDIYNNIQEISFKQGQQTSGVVALVMKIQNNQEKVKQLFIYQVIVQQTEFIIDFMDKDNNVVRFTAAREGNEQLLYKTFEVSFINLAKQKAINEYPQLLDKKLFSLQNTGFIIFLASDQSISLSLIFEDYKFIVNSPVRNIGGEGSLISGNFKVFQDFDDPRYLSALDFIKNQFTELVDAQIVQVKSQPLSGINFLLSLFKEKTGERYILKVFHDYRGVNQLIQGYKNGRIIYKLEHDYNRDQSFLKNYLKVVKQSQVFNIPPITSVSKKISENIFTFRVNYNFQQFMEFIVNLQTQKSSLQSYNVGGQNLNQLLSQFKNKATRRSPHVLINFFKSEKTIVVGQKIRQITYNQPYYTIVLTLPTGTYKAVIEDKGGELFLISYVKLNEQTCFDLSSAQVQSDSVIAAVDAFLKTHYPIKQYNVQSIQVKVLQGLFQYRYLYANQRLKQVQFYLKEVDSQISVNKASILNYDYEIVDPSLDQKIYTEFSQSIEQLDIGFKEPLYVQKNNTFIRSYFDYGTKTVQVLYDWKKLQIYRSQTLAIVDYLIVPEDFSLNGLKIPSIDGSLPAKQQLQQIDFAVKNASQKYHLYIINPSVVFAQKIGTNQYLIMTSTEKGFIRFKADIKKSQGDDDDDSDDDDEIKKMVGASISNVIITNYQESDFSNCKKYSITGQCLKCAENQLIYQGSCFSKLQGCLIQAGSLCLKCASNYLSSKFKCYNQCNLFF